MPKWGRKTIHFKDHVTGFLEGGNRSLSSRMSAIVDRYSEALRRSPPIVDRFSKAQQTALIRALSAYDFDPASRIFGNIALALRDDDVPLDLIKKIDALTPFEQVQLVEWIEGEQGEG